MAGDSSQEKTEEATPKKLREARKKGQVPKSRDVSTIVVLIIVFAMLAVGMGWAGQQIKGFMTLAFEQASNPNSFQGGQFVELGTEALLTLAKVFLPIALAAVVVGAFSGFLQVGSVFATDPLKPKLQKLNALEGLKNMFKTQTFIELIKNIAKMTVVFYLAYSTMKGEIQAVLRTVNSPIEESAAVTGGLIFSFMVKVLIAFLFISMIDFIVQKKQFMKQMRMTKDEVKREYKQDEGDPMIKGQRKQIHREMVFGDVKRQVAKSDVVVTNPNHVAVALKYDRSEMVAPEIMIRGQRSFADTIKKYAEEFEIPMMRNVPLAWALFDLEEGEEIPEELYEAVAEILSYVYRMKQEKEKEAGQTQEEVEYV
ncbi:MAG: type III secretion system export apparatus subunit SctU [Deltaproteobacteria bacterium]|nr:type III secretion system export apparatus subunit SctU [Deltaproteobacteria bacterium]